ncbi:lipoprotein [Streptomyces sp. NPDC012637]|uniref:lipoprotein n=1 Tax=Streptomyces sp. NPDC012637 TaxID=3364842 RepID=UPI0036F04965
MPERAPIRTAVPAALLAAGLLLTGCGTEKDPAGPPAPASGPRNSAPAAGAQDSAPAEGVAAAAPAGALGGAGTACALPVTFSLAEDWKPKAIDAPADPEVADLLEGLFRQGPATALCEVDAKPAGNIGFLRVWSAPKGPLRSTLEAFVKAEDGSREAVYAETKAGALPAVEVTYAVHSEIMEETSDKRALAVATPKGVVIVHLGGLDSEEHRAMLPAYELAKSTLKVS